MRFSDIRKNFSKKTEENKTMQNQVNINDVIKKLENINDDKKQIINKIIEKLNDCIKELNSMIQSSEDTTTKPVPDDTTTKPVPDDTTVEPPIIICEPEPPVIKQKYKLFTPHHEVLSDIYFSNDKRNIFNSTELEKELKAKTNSNKYFIFYPSGGQDAIDFANKKINVDIISERVIEQVGENFEGYGLLDYENDWFRTLDKGLGNKEHSVITEVMIDALKSLRKMFPKIKWSYYGLPKIPYWIPKLSPSYSWGTAPDKLKEETLLFYQDAYKDLLKECDFINVSLYNRYDPDVHPKNQPNLLNSEYEYRKNCAFLANKIKKINQTNIPIFAMFHQTYVLGGSAQYVEKLIPKEFLANSLFDPYMSSGVDGFMYWDALHYYASTCFPTINTVNPNWQFANAFAKNFGFDYAKIPWKFGQAPENERNEWRNKYVSLYSRKCLELMEFVNIYVNK